MSTFSVWKNLNRWKISQMSHKMSFLWSRGDLLQNNVSLYGAICHRLAHIFLGVNLLEQNKISSLRCLCILVPCSVLEPSGPTCILYKRTRAVFFLCKTSLHSQWLFLLFQELSALPFLCSSFGPMPWLSVITFLLNWLNSVHVPIWCLHSEGQLKKGNTNDLSKKKKTG